jgi:hypothetical protein
MSQLSTNELNQCKEKAKADIYVGYNNTLDKALDKCLDNFIKEVIDAQKQKELIQIGFNHAYDG